jgi:hypothetical protein
METFRDFRTLFNEMKEEFGGNEEAASAVGPKWLQQYGPLLQTGMSLLDNVMKQRATGGVGNVPVPMQPGQPQQGQPNVPPQHNPGATAPNMQAQATALPPGITTEDVAFIEAIKRPLIAHLAAEEVTGGDFANWLVNGWDEPVHAQLASLGPDQLMMMLGQFPSLAGDPLFKAIPPARLHTFLSEFCSVKWEDGEEDTGEATGNPADNSTDTATKATPIDGGNNTPSSPSTPSSTPPKDAA